MCKKYLIIAHYNDKLVWICHCFRWMWRILLWNLVFLLLLVKVVFDWEICFGIAYPDQSFVPQYSFTAWEFADSRLVRSVGSSGTCSKQTRTASNKLQSVLGSLELHFYEDFWAQTLAALHRRLRKLPWRG